MQWMKSYWEWGLEFFAQIHRNLSWSDVLTILPVLCVRKMNTSALHSVKFFGSEECSDGGQNSLPIPWQCKYSCLFQILNLALFFFSFTTSVSLRQLILGSPKKEGIGGSIGQRKSKATSVQKVAAAILGGSHQPVRKQRLPSSVMRVPLCSHTDSSGHLESTGAFLLDRRLDKVPMGHSAFPS